MSGNRLSYLDEQVDATMRTDSTRTRCAVLDEEFAALDEALPALEDEDVLVSSVPRISTSWFACCVSSLLSPSRMYVEPLVPAVLLLPAVDGADELGGVDELADEDAGPIFACVNTNVFADALELEPAVAAVEPLPEVPTAPPI